MHPRLQPMLLLVLMFLCASCAPAVPQAVSMKTTPTQKPPIGPTADRPVYELGEKWIRTDGIYELLRIEGERYVFVADRGREMHLTKNLGLTKAITEDGVTWELLPPPSLEWPLKVGAIAEGNGLWRSGAEARPWQATWRWEVVGYEDLKVPARSFKACRVELRVQAERATANFAPSGEAPRRGNWTVVMWYAPEARQFVKVTGQGLDFEVAAVESIDVVPLNVALEEPGRDAHVSVEDIRIKG